MAVDDFNTTSAPKFRALQARIEANEAASAALRAGGQGAGLGKGSISGANGSTTILGTGATFVADVTIDDEIYVNGETLVVASITNANELEVDAGPATDFSDQAYSWKTP